MNAPGATLASPLQLPVHGTSPGTAAFVERAVSIAEGLRAQAAATPNGEVVWRTPPAGGTGPQALDPHLYSGTVGVAYFLAALDHVRGTAEFRDLALQGLAPLRRKIAALADDPERAERNRAPVGGLVGVGSWIYGMVRMAEWLDEPALAADAHRATRLLTPARIAADDQLDVTRGCAGAILALLALDPVAPEANARGDTPLDLARACAAHLLEHRVSHEGAPRAWPVSGQPPRNGFAHGASGIAHALLRLHERTEDAAYREAALEGLAYERHLYDPVERNWWDPHYDRYLQLQSWCFGAPGVVLARLEALRDGGGEEIRPDLEEALDLTAAHHDEPVDHLCCGNFGRADILVSAARALGRPALLETARAVAGRALLRAPDDEGFGLIPPGTVPVLRLSLFRGVAGIGYVLLRLAHPRALPSPLCME